MDIMLLAVAVYIKKLVRGFGPVCFYSENLCLYSFLVVFFWFVCKETATA